ncbi:hypothetical protein Vi05172_g11657 [Venturia inaequalis]|nr:hypothetical protein Vi05172_g11657 [Venturia inaequalis]
MPWPIKRLLVQADYPLKYNDSEQVIRLRPTSYRDQAKTRRESTKHRDIVAFIMPSVSAACCGDSLDDLDAVSVVSMALSCRILDVEPIASRQGHPMRKLKSTGLETPL